MPKGSPTARLGSLLAILHTQRREWSEAELVNRRALEISDARRGPGNSASLGIRHNLATNLADAGNNDAGIREMREVLRGQQARGENGRTEAARAQRSLCRMQRDKGELVEAQACIEEALAAAIALGQDFEIRETQTLAAAIAQRMGLRDEAVHQACQAWALMGANDPNPPVAEIQRLLSAMEVDQAELEVLCGTGEEQ